MSTARRSLLLAVALVGCGPGVSPTLPDGGAADWVPGVSSGPMIPAEDPDRHGKSTALGGNRMTAGFGLYGPPINVPQGASEVLVALSGCGVDGIGALGFNSTRLNAEGLTVPVSEQVDIAVIECASGVFNVETEARFPLGPKPYLTAVASGPASTENEGIHVSVRVLGWWMPAP